MNSEYDIKAGDKVHFIGVGGIGMSALAQLFVSIGCEVSGSDRDAGKSENQTIIAPLKAQNISIFPQDGSYIKSLRPDCLVYSTAIESDNPDFLAAPDIPRVHRAGALRAAIRLNNDKLSIAVTGSCGKSSVTAWLAESLDALGAEPACLNGALVNSFRTAEAAGNYRHGNGRYFVFEADESDKSLLAYKADYAIILNMGTDHYSKEELIEVFSTFAANTSKAVIVQDDVFNLIKDTLPEDLKVIVFGTAKDADWIVDDYWIENGKAYAKVNGIIINLPIFGRHNAFNAAAVLAMLTELGFDKGSSQKSLENFQGVWRRFDFAGNTPSGAAVYDDYAHNPEKIASCIKAAQEFVSGNIYAVYQPHGFRPLGFMRDALFAELEQVLRGSDQFVLLPPFYAGGTSSFKPTATEVIEDYKSNGEKNYHTFESRSDLKQYLRNSSKEGDLILVMGARDNSLSTYAAEIAEK